MAIDTLERTYLNLIEKNTELENTKNRMTERLKEGGFIQGEQKNLEDVLDKFILNDDFPAVDVQDLVKRAGSLIKVIKTFKDLHEKDEFFDISRKKAARKAEREDAWKLWRDKLGRWLLGVSAAVLLYSALVALSKWWGFIVIPVRDLVVGG